MSRPLIKLADYERIFQIVHSVSDAIGNTTGKACLFYNVIGAAILRSNYKIKAIPVMGAAFVLVDEPSDTVLSFGHMNNESESSSSDAFHCWVQADEYVFDFTAPVYSDSLATAGYSQIVPRKMFQKPLSIMSESPKHMEKEGDFYFAPNPQLTVDFFAKLGAKPAMEDLAKICMGWFKKPPKTIPDNLRMMNDLGKVTSITLSRLKLTGAW